MKNDLTCEIVRDLLPSYVDGLTNDVSNQAVEQHMKICENCRKIYHEMQETVNGGYLSVVFQVRAERQLHRCAEIIGRGFL